MPKHFLYCMNSEDPDPQKTGDTGSWFNHYKVSAGETFVPVEGELYLQAESGDSLWFLLDGFIVGRAKVLRIDHGPLGRGEVFYDSDCLFVPIRASFKTEFGSVICAIGMCIRREATKVGSSCPELLLLPSELGAWLEEQLSKCPT